MPLTKEQIQKLLAIPEKQPRKRKSGPDTSVRDYQTWFALAHKLFDEDTRELVICENPNCEDTRENKSRVVTALVNDHYMCRLCFLAGWLIEDPNQMSIGTGDASE
jgi:hypothetical protein